MIVGYLSTFGVSDIEAYFMFNSVQTNSIDSTIEDPQPKTGEPQSSPSANNRNVEKKDPAVRVILIQPLLFRGDVPAQSVLARCCSLQLQRSQT